MSSNYSKSASWRRFLALVHGGLSKLHETHTLCMCIKLFGAYGGRDWSRRAGGACATIDIVGQGGGLGLALVGR